MSKMNDVISLIGIANTKIPGVNVLGKGTTSINTKHKSTNAKYKPIVYIVTLVMRIFSSQKFNAKVSSEIKQYYKSEGILQPLESINAIERMEMYKSTFITGLK